MSIKSWKAEFYPISAQNLVRQNASDEALIEHSIKKWEGLQPENLEKHNLHEMENNIEDGKDFFYVNSISCALCERHYDKENIDLVDECVCQTCPLYQHREARCDVEIKDEKLSPWSQWTLAKNPKPMLDALRAALADLHKQNKE